MDNLEKITYGLVAVLAGFMVFVIATHEPVASVGPVLEAAPLQRLQLDELAKRRIRIDAFGEKGMEKEVLEEYAEILKIAPDSHRDWLSLGWFYLDRQNPIEAVFLLAVIFV